MNKLMIKIFTSILLSMLIYNGLSQSVSHIVPSVVDDKIQIEYSIEGLKYYQVVTKTRLYVSMNGGEFQGPLKEITEDDPSNLGNGNHIIIWNALEEIPFTDVDLEFDVKVTIDDKDRSRKPFIAYIGNDVTPVGLRVGMIGKTPWYIEARGSLLAMDSPTYTYDGNTLIDYNKGGYYEFTGNAGWQAYSFLVGITQQISWNAFLYAGFGYGIENYILEINEYDYNNSVSTEKTWTKYEGYSNTGVEMNIGLIYRYKRILFSAGGTALNFKSFSWSGGLGYSF